MWDKVIYRMFQGCLMTVLVGVTSLVGIKVVKMIREEVRPYGRNPR